MFKTMLIELNQFPRHFPPFGFKTVSEKFHYVSYGCSCIVAFTDVVEPEDTLLVGSASVYNDYVMERELLGDHK